MKVCRLLLFVVLCIIVCLLGIAAILPTIISTHWGNERVSKLAEKFTGNKISVEKLSLSWLRPSEIRKATAQDPQGKLLFSLESAIIHKPLIKLLFSPHDLGDIEAISPQVHLYSSTTKELPKEAVTKSSSHRHHTQSSSSGFFVPSQGRLIVKNASLCTYVNNELVGSLTNMDVEVAVNMQGVSKGSFNGSITQHNVSYPINSHFEFDQTPHTPRQGFASLKFESLPTSLISSLAAPIHDELPTILQESFGESVSCHINARLENEELSLRTNLQSKNFEASVFVTSAGQKITLQPGTLLRGTVTPTMFSSVCKLAEVSSTSLDQAAVINLENTLPLIIDRTTFLPTAPFALRLAPGDNISLHVGNTSLLLGFSADFRGDDHYAKLEARAQSSVDEHKANLSCDVTVRPQQVGYHLLAETALQGEWPLLFHKLANIPVSLAIGDQCTMSARCEGKAENLIKYSLQGDMSITSPFLNGRSHFSAEKKTIQFQQTSFNWHIPSQLLTQLSGKEIFPTTESIDFSIQSPTISLPFPLNPRQIEGEVIATVSTPPLCNTAPISCSLHYLFKRNETTASLGAKCHITPRENQTLEKVTGGPIDIEINGLLDTKEASLLIPTIKIQSPNTHVLLQAIKISEAKGFTIELGEPGTFSYAIPQGILPLYVPISASGILDPCAIRMTSGQATGKIHLTSTGEFAIPKEALREEPYRYNADLRYELENRHLDFDMSIDEQTGNSSSRASGSIDLPDQLSEESLLNNTTIEATIDAQRIPISTIGLLSTRPGAEETVSAHIQCNFSGISASNCLSAKFQSPWGQGRCSLILNSHILSAKGKDAIHFDSSVPSDMINAYIKKSFSHTNLSTSESIPCSISLSNFSVDLSPFITEKSIWKTLDTATATGQFTISPRAISKNGTVIWKSGLCEGACTVDGKKRSIKCSVDCNGGAKEDIRLSIQGNIENGWTENGISPETALITADIDAVNIPTTLCEAGSKDLLENAVGPSVTAKGSLQLERMKQGKVKLDVKGHSFSCFLDGIVKEGNFTLQAPATASLTVTKRLGELLFKNVHPLLATVPHSDEPITIRIEPTGTLIPLNPFVPSRLTIPNISVTSGKFQTKNTGFIKIILALLKMGKAANKEMLDVWMTPLYMHIQNGVITCSRADALAADDVHLITWGNIDLVSQQINMIVAIPLDVLQRMGLQTISVSPDRGLQIPITGPLSNPNIETKRATAKLAGAGISSGTKSEKLQIFGALVQVAAAAGENDQPIPPPTTQPFPWEQRDAKWKK